MNTDLYSLPKDMLVKLVSMIREDTIKEYEEKIELYQEKNCVMKNLKIYHECSFPKCRAFQIIAGMRGIKHFNCKGIMRCRNCMEYFCDEHIKEGFYCSDCKEKID